MVHKDTKRYKLFLKSLKKGVTLDLGSCQGDLHKFLKENTEEKVIGVDLNKNADVIHDLNKKMPFKSSYCTNIVAGEIIEHLYNPFEFLKDCNNILKKGGRLIITTPNMSGLNYILNPKHGFDLGYTPHLYGWNLKMIKNLLRKAGFKVREARLITVFTNDNLLYRWASYILTFIIPRIKPKIFVVAEKP